MNKTVIGAVLIFLLVVVGAVAVKLLLPIIENRHQKVTSDARQTQQKITLALDNWIGYFPLQSARMAKRLRQDGLQLVCQNDQADYDARMRRLKDGEIDFAVATVDSFLLNAAAYHYPGVIVMVIDESSGGDAILARRDRVTSLDALKSRDDLRVAFTPNSPSHHLAKAAADHFNATHLLPTGAQRIETQGSADACNKLLAGKTDIAICWEPDVSRAMQDGGIVKLLGTEDTRRLVVDILIAGRDRVRNDPKSIESFLKAYFHTLKTYRDNPQLLSKDIQQESGLSAATVKTMLNGVKWVNFNENCQQWFAIARPGTMADEGLVDTIDATTQILIHAGDFKSNPIPDNDPYRLINSTFLEALFTAGIGTAATPGTGALGGDSATGIDARFTALSPAQWDRLKPVGTLKLEPIGFQSGAASLDIFAKQIIDQAVERIKHYPHFRMLIDGHTDDRGDAVQNQRLSQERAEAVARYLSIAYDIDPNRLRSRGFGGSQPLPRTAGETTRAWRYRLPRVEIIMVREDF